MPLGTLMLLLALLLVAPLLALLLVQLLDSLVLTAGVMTQRRFQQG